MAEGNVPLEHIGLLVRGVRRVHTQQITQLCDETLRGGELAGGLLMWGSHAGDDSRGRWQGSYCGAAGMLFARNSNMRFSESLVMALSYR